MAKLPPWDVVDLFRDVVSSVEKLNFWEFEFVVDKTSIGLNTFVCGFSTDPDWTSTG